MSRIFDAAHDSRAVAVGGDKRRQDHHSVAPTSPSYVRSSASEGLWAHRFRFGAWLTSLGKCLDECFGDAVFA